MPLSFNPRARMGRDLTSALQRHPHRRFQSTRPHGARHRARPRLTVRPCFNPRARMGRDVRDYLGAGHFVTVSIHAPAWGATESAFFTFFICSCFNPRARMGRDGMTCLISKRKACFNPRARMGRDASYCVGACTRIVSIHAPAWGATPRRRRTRTPPPSFNPRARMGRDLSCDLITR